MQSALLSDALAEALGRVVADVQREWRTEVKCIAAESRAFIAELQAKVLRLETELRATAESVGIRVQEALAQVKNGEPGPHGAEGQRGERGEKGNAGEKGEAGPQGERGEKGDPGEPGQQGNSGRPGEKGEPGQEGPPGLDGKEGRDGADGINGKDADPVLIERMVAELVAQIPVPQDGKDADPIQIAALVAEQFNKAVTGLPKPQDGRDGLPGLSGRDGANGLNGKDGRDGLGFEDMTENLADDGRTLIRRYTRGDEVKEFRHTLAIVLDRGVWKEQPYAKGDGVTYGGSFWISQKNDPQGKPDSGNGDWRLAVKKGRDGKDAGVDPVRR